MLSGKQARRRPLTASHEHYLRAIYEVRSDLGYARLTDVARALDVAPSTLSVGLRPLEARGLIAHDDRRFLVLTAKGERIAREVHHRFAVVRHFLSDVLGVPDRLAEAEACLMEHDVGPETTERLLDVLKLLREDDELRGMLVERMAEFRRRCLPQAECATCDLGCMTAEEAK
jgi:DtxR family Mn-dependent transcriptional regulator